MVLAMQRGQVFPPRVDAIKCRDGAAGRYPGKLEHDNMASRPKSDANKDAAGASAERDLDQALDAVIGDDFADELLTEDLLDDDLLADDLLEEINRETSSAQTRQGGDDITTSFEELERQLAAAANDLRDDEQPQNPAQAAGGRMRETGPAFPPAGLTPANDEKRSAIADLVYGLQRKPSSWPLVVASILTAFWVVLVIFYVSRNEPAVLEGGRSLLARLSDPATLLWSGVALVPSLLFFGFAAMLRRAQEMRFAAQSMTEAAIRLMQPEEIATSSVTTVGRAIRREVAAMGDGVERVLARAGELEQMVQNEVLNLQRTYSDSEIRLRTLLVDLTKERENVVGHAERLRTSIAGSHTGLTEELDAASGRIQSAIDEATRKLAETLVTREEGITARLSEAGENLVSLLSSSGTDLTQRIETGTRQIEETLTTSADNLTSRIDMTGSAVANLLETKTVRLQEQGDSLTRQFEDALSIRAAEFTSRISEAGDTLQTLLDSRLTRIDDTLSTKGDAFVQSLGVRTEALDKVLSERSQVISDTLKERLSVFGRDITTHLDNVKSDLDTRQKAIEDATTRIGETIIERSAKMENSLTTSETGIRTAMEAGLTAIAQKAAAVRESLAAESAGMLSGLDDGSKTLLAGLDERIRALSAGVEENATMLRGLMDEKSKLLFEGFAGSTSTLVGGLDQRRDALLAGIDERSQGFAAGLEERVAGTMQNVDAKTTALLTGLDSLRETIDTGMAKRSSEIERAVEAKATELGTILDAGQQTIETAIEGKYGLFSKMLDDRNRMISADLDSRIEATAGVIDEKAAAIADILTERAAIIQSTLGGGLTEAQRTLEEKTREFNELLSARSSELSAILDEQAKPIAETIRVQGEETVQKLANVNNTLNTDATNLLGRLGSISEAMDSLIQHAARDLGAMKDTITSQAAGMADAVEKARTDVERSSEIAANAHGRMDETATNLLANIGGIAERFEQQGRMLQQATQIIDAAQRDFSATLEDREGALADLAGGLSNRTMEIERSMAAFGEMLTRTMEEMTQRSRLVGTTVSTEIGTAIEETTARFAAATNAMREAANDIQRELEATRAQMRRGVMELPEETRQSADAMRKVVADQIAALRDLSEIVTKSGKALDSAPSRSTPQRAFGSETTATRPVAAPRPQPIAPAFPPRTSASPAWEAEARARDEEITRPDAAYPPAMQPRQPQAQPATPPRSQFAPQQPSPGSRQAGPGWVSDLLKRASSEEAPAVPASPASGPSPAASRPHPLHRIESLNSISMDIARLIDHEASIDLWERYQRGERNVFTRRLYTLQGQQTFEEIRDKYAREPEFRRAVDRYVEDFERLLADVAEHDRDNIMTQTYLTSDTGKVYTMLAHAAGRLGNT